MSPWLGIGAVLAALGALMAGVRIGQRAAKFSAEGSRKAVPVLTAIRSTEWVPVGEGVSLDPMVAG